MSNTQPSSGYEHGFYKNIYFTHKNQLLQAVKIGFTHGNRL